MTRRQVPAIVGPAFLIALGFVLGLVFARVTFAAAPRPAAKAIPPSDSGGGAPKPTAVAGDASHGGRSPAPVLRIATSGTASWYANGDGLYAAAGPPLRHGAWRGSNVTVCADRCVRVRLVDVCACPQRVIDLSVDAFRRLAPLERGLLRVTITY